MSSGDITARVTFERARRALEYAAAQTQAACAAGLPVAAVAPSGAPLEILRAFGIAPYFPAVVSADLAVRGEALRPLLEAESRGYPRHGCALMKVHMGSVHAAPTPAPALIVANSVGCTGYLRWFEHLSRATGAPLVVLDVPFARTEEPVPADAGYVLLQLRELIEVCERVTRRRFDEDRLREALSRSARTERAWARCRSLCRQRPAPFDAYFDAAVLAGPVNVLRGTEEAAETLEASAEALSVLATIGHSPVGEERARVVIEGAPPYSALGEFRSLFERHGAVAVASTHACAGGFFEQGFEHEAARPLESIAEHMLRENATNRTLADRVRRIARSVRDYSADAVIFHAARSCPTYSAGLAEARAALADECGAPVLLVASDTADPREYRARAMRDRIDGFFESLETRR